MKNSLNKYEELLQQAAETAGDLEAYELSRDYSELASEYTPYLIRELAAIVKWYIEQQAASVVLHEPVAWYVTGCSTMLDEHDAKAEAKPCGGSAKAVPLYTNKVLQRG